MKRHLVTTLSAVIALGTALATPPALSAGTPDRIYDIASILQGRYEGSTPGNDLMLQMSTVTIDPSHPFDIFVLVTGKYQGDNVRQQGVIRLETQGQDIYFTYIPHFNPIVTALSQDAGRFTERELTSACSFVMNPKGDGFVGNTLGSATCALAMRGAVGKWSLELEPGMLRVRNVDSGETLRWKKTEK